MKHLDFYKILIIVWMSGIWMYFYNILPEQVPIHWGIDGLPDQMGHKLILILLFPILSAFLALLFPVLSRIDPKKENYKKFWTAWEILQIGILLFFAYMYVVILYMSLHPEKSILTFMMIWLGFLFVILGNFMGKIRQNYFVWIKLPWTLNDEENWNKTHRLSGKIFVVWWGIFLLNTFFMWNPVILFVWVLISTIFIPWIYSYLLYKKKSDKTL